MQQSKKYITDTSTSLAVLLKSIQVLEDSMYQTKRYHVSLKDISFYLTANTRLLSVHTHGIYLLIFIIYLIVFTLYI